MEPLALGPIHSLEAQLQEVIPAELMANILLTLKITEDTHDHDANFHQSQELVAEVNTALQLEGVHACAFPIVTPAEIVGPLSLSPPNAAAIKAAIQQDTQLSHLLKILEGRRNS